MSFSIFSLQQLNDPDSCQLVQFYIGTPQIIHLFIGFSIIFTIHFGGPPLFIFGNTHLDA